MKSKLKVIPRTKKQKEADKLYYKTPRVLIAKDGTITSIYRHRDNETITIGRQLETNLKLNVVVTGIFSDTSAAGNMYVTTSLDSAKIAIASLVVKPNLAAV